MARHIARWSLGSVLIGLLACGAQSRGPSEDDGEIHDPASDAGASDAPMARDAGPVPETPSGNDAGEEPGLDAGPEPLPAVCSEELGCPCGLVGRIETAAMDPGGIESFSWSLPFEGVELEEDDVVVLWFSVWLPADARMWVGMDTVEGPTGLQIALAEGRTDGGLEYEAEAWTRFRVSYQEVDRELTIRVGEEEETSVHFGFHSVQSVWFRMESLRGPATAWIDGVSLFVGEWLDLVFEESFEAGDTFEPGAGRLETSEQPAGSGLPPGCS